MKEARKSLTTAEMILKRHLGWSGVKCDFCKKETTKAQLLDSMKFFGKQLCKRCQSLEKYGHR